jgi:hypothetical protein
MIQVLEIREGSGPRCLRKGKFIPQERDKKNIL